MWGGGSHMWIWGILNVEYHAVSLLTSAIWARLALQDQMGPAGPRPEIHRDKYAEGSGFPALGADDDRPPPPSKSCLTSRTKSPFHVRNCTIVHKLSSLLSLVSLASPLISNWTGQEDEFRVGVSTRPSPAHCRRPRPAEWRTCSHPRNSVRDRTVNWN